MAFFRPNHSLFYYLFPHDIFQLLAYIFIFWLGSKFGNQLFNKIHIG